MLPGTPSAGLIKRQAEIHMWPPTYRPQTMEEPVSQNEPADPDCTFVRHSLLQFQRPCNQDDHEDYDDEEDEEEEGIPP
ncbi:hypothetical protein CRUP_000021, partial [Coryphaenoides rupestris]